MTKFSDKKPLLIDADFTVNAEAANAITLNVQFKDRVDGGELGEAIGVNYYLASEATGQAVATAPDGGIAAGTDGVLIEWTANLSGLAICEADGDLDVVLTESSTGTWYLVFIAPDGKLLVSPAITFA